MRHRAQTLLSPRSEHRLLALMLILLHLALWWDFPGAVSRSLILAHLGVFLIWQPLWSRERELEWGGLLVFCSLTLGFTVWLDWWLIAFWLVLLLGLIGGRVGQRRADRAAYMIGACFLVFELIVAVVPEMFAVSSFSADIAKPLAWGLFSLPLLLFTLSGEGRPSAQSAAVDFLYGLTIALLVIVLVLGSLLSMYHFGSPYPVALFQTVLGIAVFLLAISWLWTPFAGFSGLGQLWARYLLNVGTPFEHWLGDVSLLAAQRQTPEQFLKGALERLVELPWIAGCEWAVGERRGVIGAVTAHPLAIETRGLRLRLFTSRPITTGLQLHGQLLVRLVADFHQAKLRELELAQQAHIQAVHETGARVTHDIKNLLQSLYALTVAAQGGAHSRPEELQALLARQLPHLTQRLQLALDKLQTPRISPMSSRSLRDWWEAFKRRNDTHRVEFHARFESDPQVPSELFDRVLDNLLENARFKRQSEPDTRIRVTGHADHSGLRIRVEDTGSAIPEEVAAQLLHGPVRSASGLGIGLYQSRTQAAELGYQLALVHNDADGVAFELRAPPEILPEPSAREPDAVKNRAQSRRMRTSA